MQGLAVVDGDLALSGSSYLTVSGVAKIKQDLTFALRDPYGGDIAHPYWGSILDRFIGQPSTAAMQSQVANEIQRVLTNYISVQADQINSTIAAGLATTYDTSDVVQKINNIDVQMSLDTFIVTVTLTTMAGSSVTVSRTVST